MTKDIEVPRAIWHTEEIERFYSTKKSDRTANKPTTYISMKDRYIVNLADVTRGPFEETLVRVMDNVKSHCQKHNLPGNGTVFRIVDGEPTICSIEVSYLHGKYEIALVQDANFQSCPERVKIDVQNIINKFVGKGDIK